MSHRNCNAALRRRTRWQWCAAALWLVSALSDPAMATPVDDPPPAVAPAAVPSDAPESGVATSPTSAPASAPAAPTPATPVSLRSFRATDWVRNPVVLGEEAASPAMRIVSLSPSTTEWCCALGFRGALIGRSRYCEYPPEVRDVPVVGSAMDVSAEMLVSLRPDLVLLPGSTRLLRERLSGLNLRFEALPDRTLEDVFTSAQRLGELTGRPQTAAALRKAMTAELEAITALAKQTPSSRVLLLIGTLSDPPAAPTVAGPGSFYDELLRKAGHLNIAPPDGPAFGAISLEAIVAADPQVIIELDPTGQARPRGDVDAQRAWAPVGAMSAVRSGRVHVLTGGQHYLPGPRIAETYRAICSTIAGGRE